MIVTFFVLKFSGWLKYFAPCRVQRMAYDMLGGHWGGGRACSVQLRGKARLESGRKARVECTSNISSMFLTRRVSKFNGWLNALFADCRESEGGHTMRGEGYGPGGGRRRATAVHAACRGGLDCRLGAGHGEERTKNM